MTDFLRGLVDRPVSAITNDGRHIVGTLKGFDQTVNVILEDCTERTYDPVQGVEQVPLGLYIIRGDNLAVIGEMDEAVDSQTDLSEIKAHPLKSVVH